MKPCNDARARREFNARFWRALLWERAASWRANAAEWLAAIAILFLLFVLLRAS
jgi:hypothetical protein